MFITQAKRTTGDTRAKATRATNAARLPKVAKLGFTLAGAALLFLPIQASAATGAAAKMVPAAPQNVQTVNVSNNTATLSWSPSATLGVLYEVVDDTETTMANTAGGSPVEGNKGGSLVGGTKGGTAESTIGHAAGNVIVATSATQVTLKHLHPNTNYWFIVKAVEPDGTESSASSLVIFTTGPKHGASDAGHDERIVGYYPDWAIYSPTNPVYASEIPANQVNIINYAFANIVDGKLVAGDPWSDYQKVVPGDNPKDSFQGNFDALVNMKKRNPNLKTIISVGGWTWSGQFSSMAATAESRNTFADSAVQFITEYGFDGLDLDWEYPVSGGLTNGLSADTQNFTLLLQTIRQKLDAEGAKDHKHYDLTIAASPSLGYISHVQLNQIQKYVDWINLMTYDIHGGWDPYTRLNSPCFTDQGDPSAFSDDVGVQAYLKQGVPADKIVLGTPFYGYDDSESLYYKTQYINSQHLGGAIVWDLTTDYNNQLLQALYYNLKTDNN